MSSNPLNRVYIGDCEYWLDMAIPDNYIDLTFTSPPYNVGKDYGEYDDDKDYNVYLNFLKSKFTKLYEKTKECGRLVVNIMDIGKLANRKPLISDLTQLLQDIGWKYRCRIIWQKQFVTNWTAWGSWMSPSSPNVFQPWEELIVMHKGEPKKPPRIKDVSADITADEFKEWVQNNWYIQPERPARVHHPAPFPEELAKRVIKLFSFPGDIICDIFAGSGTVGQVARRYKRKYLLFELDKKYKEIINNRISAGVNLDWFT